MGGQCSGRNRMEISFTCNQKDPQRGDHHKILQQTPPNSTHFINTGVPRYIHMPSMRCIRNKRTYTTKQPHITNNMENQHHKPIWDKMNQHQAQESIVDTLCSCITDWLDNGMVQESKYSNRYSKAIASQNKIGWRQMFMGKISTE